MKPSSDQPAVPTLRPLEFARWTWRQLCSMRTALVLLFLLAIAAIPGSLIPQERVDPSAVAAFKDRHPSVTPLFERIGMFNVYSSVWFSAIYLLLMLSLIGCIIPRFLTYARNFRARPPKAPRNLSRLSAYDTWTTEAPVEAESERARALLAGQRRRVEVYADGDDIVVSAEKGYVREAGNLLFHVALLVVLVGVAVTGLFGFKGSAAVISGNGFSNTLIQYDDFTPGAWFDSADLAPFHFAVKDFHVTWGSEGSGSGTPLTFDADLSVTDEVGAQPYDYDLRVNHPLVVDGTSVFLVGHGYAPRVTVRDGDGDVAFSGPVVFLAAGQLVRVLRRHQGARCRAHPARVRGLLLSRPPRCVTVSRARRSLTPTTRCCLWSPTKVTSGTSRGNRSRSTCSTRTSSSRSRQPAAGRRLCC